jgi:hypothetical protein
MMDKVGNWIHRNPQLFCHHGHDYQDDEQMEAFKVKTLEKFWLEAEKLIQSNQRKYLHRDCNEIREYLHPKKNYN